MTQQVRVYVDAPRGTGFGWTVWCDDCNHSESMLSEAGAHAEAREHVATHVEVVVNGTATTPETWGGEPVRGH